jgi:hypothetical protein
MPGSARNALCCTGRKDRRQKMGRRNGTRKFNRRHGNREDGSWAKGLMDELRPRETLPEKPDELSVKDLKPGGKAGPPPESRAPRVTAKPKKPYYDGRMAMPPEGNCAYCGRPLRRGEGHWVVDEFGQLVRKCNDARSCYERMGEDNQKSLKRALKRFGARGGM